VATGQQCLVYPIVLMGAVVRHRPLPAGLRGPAGRRGVRIRPPGAPVATRILIGMSDFIRHYWFYALIFIGVATWGFRRWLKAAEARLRFDRFMLRVPLAGKLIAASTRRDFPAPSAF